MPPKASIPHFLAELRRRRVIRVAAAYVSAGVAIALATEALYDDLLLPDWTPRLVIVLLVIGLPLAIGLAWAYQVTPEGVVPDRRPVEESSSEVPTGMSAPAAAPDRPSAAADPRPGLVVLPFDNLSPDPGDAWFSDGLTEEITAALSGVRSLRVISRTSAMQLKGSGKDVRSIGRDLSVRYLLEGSVRKAGDRLRVTAQLIEAPTDTHVWSERYDGEMGDVFTIQEKLSRSIADALRLQLTPGEDRGLSARPISDVAAYELYLRARQRTWEWTPGALDRARQEMQNGLDLVGANPLLHAGLAYVYFQYVNVGIENDQYMRLAEEHARRALELDPGSGEAHIVLGLLDQAFRGDQRSSFRHFRCALQRNPDDAHALIWLIVGHTIVGKAEEAGPLVERCLQVDPLNPVCRYMPVFIEVWGGRLEHSVEELSIWHRLEPDSVLSLFFSAMTLCHSGLSAEALALLERHPVKTAADVFSLGNRMLLQALSGEPEGVLAELTSQLETTGRRDPQLSYFLGDIFALAGLREAALHWLSNAVDRGFCNHPFMAVHDPMIRDLRGDPEFERIAARAKEEWSAFDA